MPIITIFRLECLRIWLTSLFHPAEGESLECRVASWLFTAAPPLPRAELTHLGVMKYLQHEWVTLLCVYFNISWGSSHPAAGPAVKSGWTGTSAIRSWPSEAAGRPGQAAGQLLCRAQGWGESGAPPSALSCRGRDAGQWPLWAVACSRNTQTDTQSPELERPEAE